MSVTYSPNKNAKGMLSLFPEAVIIAEETKGPIKAEVLPTCKPVSHHIRVSTNGRVLTTENRAKNRNLHKYQSDSDIKLSGTGRRHTFAEEAIPR